MFNGKITVIEFNPIRLYTLSKNLNNDTHEAAYMYQNLS